jgi:hypothetical protein
VLDGSTKKKLKGLDEEIDNGKKYQNVCKKKGPPCKGWEYFEKKKQATKAGKLAKNSDSDDTSDLDYEPSDNNSTDSELKLLLEVKRMKITKVVDQVMRVVTMKKNGFQ